jgi:hypothetical protein
MRRALAWALGLAVPGVGLIAAVSWWLWTMQSLSYGGQTVFAPNTDVDSQNTAPYRLAFWIGAGLTLVAVPFLTRIALRTPAKTWPAPRLGLAVAVAGLMAGAVGVLLTLGIHPVDLVLMP